MLKSDAISRAAPRAAQPPHSRAPQDQDRGTAPTDPASFQRLLARVRGAGAHEWQREREREREGEGGAAHGLSGSSLGRTALLGEAAAAQQAAQQSEAPSGGRFAGDLDTAQHGERERTRDELESALDAMPVMMAEGPGAPFVFASAEGAAAAGGRGVATPVDELFAQLVIRAAVDRGGDAKRGAMRLELGGRVVGRGHVTVHAEGDDVEIDLTAPPGVDADELAARVTGRLAAKGVRVTRFDVR